MSNDTDALNRQYFGFLETEYGFEYHKGIFSSDDVEVQIVATGYTAGVLSSIEIYVWCKKEPPCTRISFHWILMYYIDAHLYLDDSLLKNYQRLSSAFQEHASKILFHPSEWLLPAMKIHFENMLRGIYRGKLQSLLLTPSISEMYEYIKSKDPTWNPS
jgi:hypothetical protein